MRKPATLSVQVLGPFAVARDGVTVPAHELASRKGRMLLKLLVARRGAVVPAAVVAEALWGDRPPADPDANLATLVSRLRSVLGADAIAGDRHGWRFAGRYPRIVVDLDEAERLTAEAEARLDDEPALAGAAAGRARPPRARAGHGRRTGRRLGRDVRLGQVPGARPSTGRSAKYRALGLARLGRHEEAVRAAAPVASDYLLAQVATGPAARAAVDRIAAALPRALRPAFLERGRLARATARA